jgi:hypothetical protein
VDHANYSTAKLVEVDDRYYLGVSCQSCMRSARLSLTRLRGLLGADFSSGQSANPPQMLYVRIKAAHGEILGATPGGGEPGQPLQRTGAVRESSDVRQGGRRGEARLWILVALTNAGLLLFNRN